jgi:hypothetical protein
MTGPRWIPTTQASLAIDKDWMIDGCYRLAVRISTYFHLVESETYSKYDEKKKRLNTWKLQGWDGPNHTKDDLRKRITTTFKSVVEKTWSNGAIWIAHDGDKAAASKGLWCDPFLVPVEDREEAQLCIAVLNKPTPINGAPDFRASCRLRGVDRSWSRPPSTHTHASWDTSGGEGNPIDMFISAQHAVYPMQREVNGAVITQDIPSHEFGHYLGLGHACADDAVKADEGINADIAYCPNGPPEQQNQLMSYGNDLIDKYGDPFVNYAQVLLSDTNASQFKALVAPAGNKKTRPWLNHPQKGLFRFAHFD